MLVALGVLGVSLMKIVRNQILKKVVTAVKHLPSMLLLNYRKDKWFRMVIKSP